MSHTPLQQFEIRLEQLETAARSAVPLGRLCRLALEAIRALEPTTELQLWCGRQNRFDVLAQAAMESPAEMIRPTPAARTEAVIRCAASDQSDLIPDPDSATAGSRRHLLLLPRTLSDHHKLVIGLTLDSAPADVRLLTDASRALADCLSMAVSRELLNQLDEQISVETKLRHLVRRLDGCRTTTECATIIVRDGAELLGQGRVTVLEKKVDRWQIVAITDADASLPPSDAARRLTALVTRACSAHPPHRNLTGRWMSTLPAEATNDAQFDADVVGMMAEFRRTGTTRLRISQLVQNAGEPEVVAVLELFEISRQSPAIPGYAAAEDSTPAETLLNRTLAESAAAWQRCRTQSASHNRHLPGSPRTRFIAAAFLILLALWLIPAELRLTVSGQVFPAVRRRVFAPEDGVITELLVAEDETVAAGQPLLKLHNAERQLEFSRLSGDIDAARARLQSIRAARNAGPDNSGTSSASTRSSIDLSSDEQLTQQRLDSLQAEQNLIAEQLQSLLVTAPIDGIVYQQNLDQRLRTRPVKRGQELLEIVAAAGEWELSLAIPDDVSGYVRSQLIDSDSAADGPKVLFTLTADPRTVYTSTLHHLDRSSHIEDGRVRCRATARIGDLPTDRRRAGAAVSAQIHCGRHSLGYVWFREVIEYVTRKWRFGL